MQQQIEKLLSDRCMLDRGGMGPRADPAAATGQEGTRGSSCQAIIAKPRAAGGEPGLDLPLVTGRFTAVTGLTGLDRLRYRPVTNR
jgi:hypothetical protein